MVPARSVIVFLCVVGAWADRVGGKDEHNIQQFLVGRARKFHTVRDLVKRVHEKGLFIVFQKSSGTYIYTDPEHKNNSTQNLYCKKYKKNAFQKPEIVLKGAQGWGDFASVCGEFIAVYDVRQEAEAHILNGPEDEESEVEDKQAIQETDDECLSHLDGEVKMKNEKFIHMAKGRCYMVLIRNGSLGVVKVTRSGSVELEQYLYLESTQGYDWRGISELKFSEAGRGIEMEGLISFKSEIQSQIGEVARSYSIAQFDELKKNVEALSTEKRGELLAIDGKAVVQWGHMRGAWASRPGGKEKKRFSKKLQQCESKIPGGGIYVALKSKKELSKALSKIPEESRRKLRLKSTISKALFQGAEINWFVIYTSTSDGVRREVRVERDEIESLWFESDSTALSAPGSAEAVTTAPPSPTASTGSSGLNSSCSSAPPSPAASACASRSASASRAGVELCSPVVTPAGSTCPSRGSCAASNASSSAPHGKLTTGSKVRQGGSIWEVAKGERGSQAEWGPSSSYKITHETTGSEKWVRRRDLSPVDSHGSGVIVASPGSPEPRL